MRGGNVFSVTVFSFKSRANLLTVINKGLAFLDSELGKSVDKRFRFVYFLFFCNMNLSLFSSPDSEELKTSFDTPCK